LLLLWRIRVKVVATHGFKLAAVETQSEHKSWDQLKFYVVHKMSFFQSIYANVLGKLWINNNPFQESNTVPRLKRKKRNPTLSKKRRWGWYNIVRWAVFYGPRSGGPSNLENFYVQKLKVDFLETKGIGIFKFKLTIHAWYHQVVSTFWWHLVVLSQ
jgi:hypothetical protein